MSVFVDTSALYAVLDADDTNHARARLVWKELVQSGEALTTSNYVLVEASALIQSRLGMTALRVFCEDVAPLLDLEWIDHKRHASAVAAALTANRTKLSLVDCVSFAIMRELDLRSAFCFDRHFAEQGFVCIPN